MKITKILTAAAVSLMITSAMAEETKIEGAAVKKDNPPKILFDLKDAGFSGYGGIYTCRKKNGEWVSVLGAGYADGVFRSLSDQGIGVYERSGQRVKFLGRVSMDLCAVQGLSASQIGDRVILWGDVIDPYEQAGLAGTIPYEITTRIGETERVTRNYV